MLKHPFFFLFFLKHPFLMNSLAFDFEISNEYITHKYIFFQKYTTLNVDFTHMLWDCSKRKIYNSLMCSLSPLEPSLC